MRAGVGLLESRFSTLLRLCCNSEPTAGEARTPLSPMASKAERYDFRVATRSSPGSASLATGWSVSLSRYFFREITVHLRYPASRIVRLVKRRTAIRARLQKHTVTCQM